MAETAGHGADVDASSEEFGGVVKNSPPRSMPVLCSACPGRVIGAIEERLPISPYWRAEWKALGEGKNTSRYLPLTHLEQWIPMLFGTTYLAAFIAVLLA